MLTSYLVLLSEYLVELDVTPGLRLYADNVLRSIDLYASIAFPNSLLLPLGHVLGQPASYVALGILNLLGAAVIVAVFEKVRDRTLSYAALAGYVVLSIAAFLLIMPWALANVWNH